MRYDILNPEQDKEASINRLAETVSELLVKAWERDGKDTYGRPFNLNVVALIQSWLSGALKVFVAYEGDKPVGVVLGFNFRPISFECNVLQVETLYTINDEVEKGLIDYVSEAIRFLGIEEVWFTKNKDRVPFKLNGWEQKESLETCRFVKK